jgi:hypothetical protein
MAASFIGQFCSEFIGELLKGIGLKFKDLPFTAPTETSAFLVYFVQIAIAPAFLEEFMFRGVVLQSLRKYGDGFAIFISALLFGLMHGNFMQIPYAFIIGLIIGYFVVKTGSLWIGIFIHFCNNGIGAVASLVSQKIGTHYEIIFNLSYYLAISLLGIISLIYFLYQKGSFTLPKKESDSVTLPAGAAMKAFILSPTILIFIAYSFLTCLLFLQKE